jgi:uncharacterized protein (TIGR02599 family)
MDMKTPSLPRSARGFSLIELMVSTAVLSLMLVLVFQMLKQMQLIWKQTKQTVGSYKDARQGFEEMSRRVSQATLNAYYSYVWEETKLGTATLRLGREIIPQSELHFVSGPVETLGIGEKKNATVGARYTHAVFFQAPFGFVIDPAKTDETKRQFDSLNRAVNAWGYFIEFNTDELERPKFLAELNNSPLPRPRYRLMEFRQPAEYLQIYKLNLRTMEKASKNELYRWFNEGNYSVNSSYNASTEPLVGKGNFRTTRVVAENIIGMILRPRDSDDAKSGSREESLAPDYHFDSRKFQWGTDTKASAYRHILPPIIDVTFIAVDEGTFSRFCSTKNIRTAEEDPALIEKDLFKKATDFQKDLKTVEDSLTEKKIDFRIFNTSIRIRESKWTDAEESLETGANP